ncbi:carcinoembryonic antigen-related cell adhesion molecule 2 [Thalassophryne amazonica]|uniref:carcinoembryonic antigen-related cell adhesion molecule 2 n=1 Tax=Thalassophryne amazonica TaxID=390379 RepID=UPI001470D0D4|nr:carcinoembryonic antigen-related cell adhesion molecule 2 [Thalassophryne amazonica]
MSVPTVSCHTNLIEGSSVNITCDAEHSSAQVWMKDGKPLDSGDRFTLYDGNRVLSISPVDRTDTGQFVCNASNIFSFETASCKFNVNYGPDKPIITQEPIGAELEEAVTLSCSANSLPGATFTWTFKNQKIKGPVYEIYEMEEKHLGQYTLFLFHQ